MRSFASLARSLDQIIHFRWYIFRAKSAQSVRIKHVHSCNRSDTRQQAHFRMEIFVLFGILFLFKMFGGTIFHGANVENPMKNHHSMMLMIMIFLREKCTRALDVDHRNQWIPVTIYFCLPLMNCEREKNKIGIKHFATIEAFHFISLITIVITRYDLFMCQNNINKNKSNKFYFICIKWMRFCAYSLLFPFLNR